MAKRQFLDSKGLEELIKHIPILVQGDNITLTPDETNSNKITISSSQYELATDDEIDGLFDN